MTRTWRAALTAAAACVMAACTLSACTSIGSTAGGSDGGPVDALKIGVFLDVTSWDPALADIGFDGPYLSAVYDPLVALDAESNPIPALATSWEYSPDFRTLTMDLRTGVTLDDGQAFDAAAAVANLEHLKAGARSGSTYRNVESVEAVDPDTIVIHLTEKDDALL
ncbi:MAG: ABC transporter substrate-binding protein, partial [Actinomycetes bacterium]